MIYTTLSLKNLVECLKARFRASPHTLWLILPDLQGVLSDLNIS